MPNQHSKAGHIAQRTCVVCRDKCAKDRLLSFLFLDGKLVFDLNSAIQCRKFYLCSGQSCVDGLSKWIKRYQKKHSASMVRGAG